MGEVLRTIAEEVGAADREQALFRSCVRLDRAVGADMADGESALDERPSNQQAAVAIERFALGTKKADALALARIHHAPEAGRKFLSRGIPSSASRCASCFAENQGHQRENGTERTSATALTPAFLSNAMKRSAARLEWPIVKRS